jgi:hypothetical protein
MLPAKAALARTRILTKSPSPRPPRFRFPDPNLDFFSCLVARLSCYSGIARGVTAKNANMEQSLDSSWREVN